MSTTTKTRTNKRNADCMAEEASLSDSTSATRVEDEKTIPFLRRLTDMLRENDEVISFFPGYCENGKLTLGKIVVHDRHKVESEVLPRYFNHASFASLRRQLNYFSFTRVGKGRQRGATYCNEAVIELDDILHLKRRTVGANSTHSRESCIPEFPSSIDHSPSQNIHNSSKNGLPTAFPLLRFANHSDGKGLQTSNKPKRSRKEFSRKRTQPVLQTGLLPQMIGNCISDEEADVPTNTKVTIDSSATEQTKPGSSCSFRQFAGLGSGEVLHRSAYESLGVDYRYMTEMSCADADILAGCNALLSFSRSRHGDGIKYTA